MIAAATEIVTGDGVAACTIDEVARRSGVAKTTLYRHFGGVDALLLAVLDGLVQASPVPDTGSLRGDLRVISQRYLAVARVPTSRQLFTWMLSRSMNDPAFAEQFRRVRVQPRGPTTIALQRAIARGELDPEIDLDLAMHMVQGPMISKRIIENEEPTPEQFDAMIDMIIRALVRRVDAGITD